MKEKLGIAALALAALVVLGFGIETIMPLPPETTILYDSATGYYATPACVLSGTTSARYIKNRDQISKPGTVLTMQDSVNKTSLGAARQRQAQPDPACRDADGFAGRRGSLLGDLLRDFFDS